MSQMSWVQSPPEAHFFFAKIFSFAIFAKSSPRLNAIRHASSIPTFSTSWCPSDMYCKEAIRLFYMVYVGANAFDSAQAMAQVDSYALLSLATINPRISFRLNKPSFIISSLA